MLRGCIVFPLAMALLNVPMALSQSERPAHEGYRVKVLKSLGDEWQSQKVMLNLEPDRIVLRDPKAESGTESIQYSGIKSAEYSYSKNRRQLSPATAVAGNVFSLLLLMTKVENHWLTIQSEGHKTILNLDKNNYKAVVTLFEARLGTKVAGWNAN